MPPFTTINGKTGYYYNGQFVPATQEEYNAQFGMLQQFGGNPFLNAAQQSPLNNQRTNFVQQGTIQGPEAAGMTNEQKVMQAQGDNTSTNQYNPQDALKYEMTDKGLGFNVRDQFYPSNAMTASGMPLIGNPFVKKTENAYQLAADQNYKYGNPAVTLNNDLISGNFTNSISSPTQQIDVPKIASTATNAISSVGSQIGSKVGSTVSDVVDKGLKDDVIGDWGNWGFSGKEFFKSDAGKNTSAIAGAGVGLVSGLVKAGAPDKYDQRVGMSKPNLGGNLFGDATFTQVGLNPALMAATGGISALVGGGVDLIKNAVKYAKQKDRYENKKLATDTMQSIDDARENMKPDYTGYARFGTQVTNPYLKARSGIYIKLENRGKFTKWAQSHDMGVQEAANTVMSNKEEYSPSVVKMANFAKNASKWGRYGLETEPEELKKKVDEANINTISLESAGPETTEPDELQIATDKAYNTMENILGSKGYKKKLANELRKSNKMSYSDQVVYNNPFAPNRQQTRYEVYRKNNDDSYEGRSLLNRRREALDPSMVSYMDENDKLYDSAGAYYHPGIITNDKIGDATKYMKQINPYIKVRRDEPTKYHTLIEEFEHSTHFPAMGRVYKSEALRPSGQNITPYAQKIIMENTDLKYEDNDYLTEPTEVLAKKRATEAYLIENNLLKPGEKVNKSHYDFLEKNYEKLPRNVRSMFDITDKNIDILNVLNNKISLEKVNKKRRQTQYKRFENIMNKIAMQQNPYTNEPIS